MDRIYVIRHKWHHEGLSIRQIGTRCASTWTAWASRGGGRRASGRSRCWRRSASGSTRSCGSGGSGPRPSSGSRGTLVHQQLLREGYWWAAPRCAPVWRNSGVRGQDVYLPLVWRDGDAAQVDFFEVTVEVAGHSELLCATNQSRSRTRATCSGSFTTAGGSGKVSPRKWMVPRCSASRSADAGRGRRKASAAA